MVKVLTAVRREFRELRSRADVLDSDVAVAEALARMIDDATNSATSRTAAARELGETMRRMRERVPADAQPDAVTGIQERARLKLAGGG